MWLNYFLFYFSFTKKIFTNKELAGFIKKKFLFSDCDGGGCFFKFFFNNNNKISECGQYKVMKLMKLENYNKPNKVKEIT